MLQANGLQYTIAQPTGRFGTAMQIFSCSLSRKTTISEDMIMIIMIMITNLHSESK